MKAEAAERLLILFGSAALPAVRALKVRVEGKIAPEDWEYSINSGFSFSFGSIYNNVVNNRFF